MADARHNAATAAYNRRQDAIMIRPDNDTGARIRAAAAAAGIPLQRWIVGVLLDRIEKEGDAKE